MDPDRYMPMSIKPYWISDTTSGDNYPDSEADEEPRPPLMTLADYRIVDDRIAHKADSVAACRPMIPVGYPDILMLDSMSRPPPFA